MKKRGTDSILEVRTTAKDQEKMRADGVSEDEIPSAGVRRYRRSRFRVAPQDVKVKISMYLDGDVLEYFRKRGMEPNAAPYQTQINNELRKIMENGSAETSKVEHDILNDKKFLKALKKKLEAV